MGTRFDVRDLQALRAFYRSQLLEDCAPFWMAHSLDREYGGYLTMLDRDGSIYGTGKYIWPQARQAYLLAKLYNRIERDPAWLDASRLGIEFLDRYALDENGRAYYKVARDGTPLYSRPGEIFVESFIILAMSQYAKASGDERYLNRAENLFWDIIGRLENGAPDGQSGVRMPPYREHAPGMIMMNTTQELRAVRDDPRYTDLTRSTESGSGTSDGMGPFPSRSKGA